MFKANDVGAAAARFTGLAIVAVATAIGCSTTPSGSGEQQDNDSGAQTEPDTDGGAPQSAIDAGKTVGKDATAPGRDAGSDATTTTGEDASTLSDAKAPADAALPPPPPVDAEAFSGPGTDTTVTAFNQTLICFGSGGTGPCSRTVDAAVTFPATGTYSKILMHLTLNCPSNSCDPWDRVGSIDLVPSPSSDGGVEDLIELGRFVTPYNIVSGVNSPPVWDIDVTELRPLLLGKVNLRAFIDTWDPQGNAAQNGGGWVLGATFEMTGGTPAKVPIVVLPIWTWKTTGKEPTQITYGDQTVPISTSLPPQTITLPAGPTGWGVRSTITGHGQANLDDCAEFCSRNHTWTVGTHVNQSTVFRTDCSNYPSSGTYQNSRAGWCPGTFVVPWDFDVTSQVNLAAATTFTYGVDDYINTCNGNAPASANLCTACAAQGVSCPYNGGSHTGPFYYVSSLLIGFR
jgi:hypothetical protein